jgi:hypothetical protein
MTSKANPSFQLRPTSQSGNCCLQLTTSTRLAVCASRLNTAESHSRQWKAGECRREHIDVAIPTGTRKPIPLEAKYLPDQFHLTFTALEILHRMVVSSPPLARCVPSGLYATVTRCFNVLLTLLLTLLWHNCTNRSLCSS